MRDKFPYKYIDGYIFDGTTFVLKREDIHNAGKEMFVEGTALLPKDMLSCNNEFAEKENNDGEFIGKCPFCGSTSLIVDKKSRLAGFNGLEERIEWHIYSVRCNKCKARGPVTSGLVFAVKNYHNLPDPDWATTDEEIKSRAIDLWNGRLD